MHILPVAPFLYPISWYLWLLFWSWNVCSLIPRELLSSYFLFCGDRTQCTRHVLFVYLLKCSHFVAQAVPNSLCSLVGIKLVDILLSHHSRCHLFHLYQRLVELINQYVMKNFLDMLVFMCVPVRVAIAMMKYHDQSNLRRKKLPWWFITAIVTLTRAVYIVWSDK